MPPDLLLVAHVIAIYIALSHFLPNHLFKLVFSIVLRVTLIATREELSLNALVFLGELLFPVYVAPLLKLLNLDQQRVLWLSPSWCVFILGSKDGNISQSLRLVQSSPQRFYVRQFDWASSFSSWLTMVNSRGRCLLQIAVCLRSDWSVSFVAGWSRILGARAGLMDSWAPWGWNRIVAVLALVETISSSISAGRWTLHNIQEIVLSHIFLSAVVLLRPRGSPQMWYQPWIWLWPRAILSFHHLKFVRLCNRVALLDRIFNRLNRVLQPCLTSSHTNIICIRLIDSSRHSFANDICISTLSILTDPKVVGDPTLASTAFSSMISRSSSLLMLAHWIFPLCILIDSRHFLWITDSLSETLWQGGCSCKDFLLLDELVAAQCLAVRHVSIAGFFRFSRVINDVGVEWLDCAYLLPLIFENLG